MGAGRLYGRQGGLEREAIPEIGGRSVNADTDWEKVPECRLAAVITEIITQILNDGRCVGHRSVYSGYREKRGGGGGSSVEQEDSGVVDGTRY